MLPRRKSASASESAKGEKRYRRTIALLLPPSLARSPTDQEAVQSVASPHSARIHSRCERRRGARERQQLENGRGKRTVLLVREKSVRRGGVSLLLLLLLLLASSLRRGCRAACLEASSEKSKKRGDVIKSLEPIKAKPQNHCVICLRSEYSLSSEECDDRAVMRGEERAVRC